MEDAPSSASQPQRPPAAAPALWDTTCAVTAPLVRVKMSMFSNLTPRSKLLLHILHHVYG